MLVRKPSMASGVIRVEDSKSGLFFYTNDGRGI